MNTILTFPWRECGTFHISPCPVGGCRGKTSLKIKKGGEEHKAM